MNDEIEYRHRLPAKKAGWNSLRCRYCEMKNHITDQEPAVKGWPGNPNPKPGWNTKAVFFPVSRLHLKGWRDDYFNINNADVLFYSAIPGALITECSFLYIQIDDEDGFLRIEIINGNDAADFIDLAVRLLKEGCSVLCRDQLGNPADVEAIKVPGEAQWITGGKAGKTFGICFKNAGYLGSCLTAPGNSTIFESYAYSLFLIGIGTIRPNQLISCCFGLDNTGPAERYLSRRKSGAGAGK